MACREQVWGAAKLPCGRWTWVTTVADPKLVGSKLRFKAALVVDVTVLCNLIFQQDEAKEAQT